MRVSFLGDTWADVFPEIFAGWCRYLACVQTGEAMIQITVVLLALVAKSMKGRNVVGLYVNHTKPDDCMLERLTPL